MKHWFKCCLECYKHWLYRLLLLMEIQWGCRVFMFLAYLYPWNLHLRSMYHYPGRWCRGIPHIIPVEKHSILQFIHCKRNFFGGCVNPWQIHGESMVNPPFPLGKVCRPSRLVNPGAPASVAAEGGSGARWRKTSPAPLTPGRNHQLVTFLVVLWDWWRSYFLF